MSKSSAPKRKQLIKRDGTKCHYCGKEMDMSLLASNRDGITVEHMNPKCKDGTNNIENLVLACRSCNSRKGKKHYQEFKMALDTNTAILFLMGDENDE